MPVFRDKKEVLTWYFSQTKKSKHWMSNFSSVCDPQQTLPASTMWISSPNLTFLHLMSRKAFCPEVLDLDII